MDSTLSFFFSIGVVMTMIFLTFVWPSAFPMFLICAVIGVKAMYHNQ